MKFTKIPTTTFETLQLNAGILLSSFDPDTATVTAANILGATTGGINFKAVPSFVDFGEDVDNCPKNMMELKHLDSWDITMSGTYLTMNTTLAKSLLAAADVDITDATMVTPRVDLKTADFANIWWVGDYSDKNGATNGGFVAIEMKNALSTGGFQIQTANKEKGQFAFEYTAHFSNAAQETVPCVLYIQNGTAEPAG